MQFSKKLKPTEANYKLIEFDKDFRDEFVEGDNFFTIKFQGKEYKLRVADNKNQFMISPLYDDYKFQIGDEIKIKKIGKKIFELTLE